MILQTAKVLALASLVALPRAGALDAQVVARVTVTATVVDGSTARAALATMKWLTARKGSARKEAGLVTIDVNRERGKVLINYLRN